MDAAKTNGILNMTAPSYGTYLSEVYFKGTFHNVLPSVTCDPNQLESQAKKSLSEKAYNYVAGGAGERQTMDANRLAFRQWRLIPRMLRHTSPYDLRTELFGKTVDCPILCAPVGVLQIFHEDRELGVAQIAAKLGIPYILSTAATSSIEEVAKANGDGHRWYQLYWPNDDEVTLSLLKRAKSNGYSALVVTLDCFSLASRPWDLDVGYLPFLQGLGDQIGFSDPVFRRKFEERHGYPIEQDILQAARDWLSCVFSGRIRTWDDIDFLRKNWEGPLLVKGIQHVDDAKLAVEHGVDGIVVSNHGGRQQDGAIGSLDMLPEIVAAVGDKATILFDSGIRTGVDVIKALCLGAKAVLVGRPWVYGLGVAGKEGAKVALQGILADLYQSIGLAGIGSIENCNRSVIRKVDYPGDRHSSN